MSMLFGFTGTPIHEEIGKEGLGTADIFGNELHRYSIANGIEDKNVLGFDPYMVCTYNDKEVRTAVGLQEAKVTDISEIFGDKKKEDIFYYYQNTCPMAGYVDGNGTYVKGVEDFIPRSQYDANDTHHMQVVEDIKKNFLTLSRGHKFHAIFATSSIPEAIAYYRLLKANTDLRITAMFDDNDPEDAEVAVDKNNALMEILDDYNNNFGQTFTLSNFGSFKKDAFFIAFLKFFFCDEKIGIFVFVGTRFSCGSCSYLLKSGVNFHKFFSNGCFTASRRSDKANDVFLHNFLLLVVWIIF
jgi:type I restriction enzyme R subunit